MHHSHSMGVFNNVLIKRICILFVVLSRLRTANKFPRRTAFTAFLQFYVTLMVAHWITPWSILCTDCITDRWGRVSVSSMAHGIFPVAFWCNVKVEAAVTLKDWLWPKRGVGCLFDSLLRRVWHVEASESHRIHGEASLEGLVQVELPSYYWLHWSAFKWGSFQLKQ